MKIIDCFVNRRNYLVLFFTIAYLSAFTNNAISNSNYEFLYYTVIMVFLIYLTVVVNKQLSLAFFILVSLSLLGFLHLLGGNYYLPSGVRLYDAYFLNVLRYDNIVHTFGTFIATLTLYGMVAEFIDPRLKKRFILFSVGLILMALGVGTINELLEFFAVLIFDVSEQVGGYYNNALDLLFNVIGSIFAIIIIYFYRKVVDTNEIKRQINGNSSDTDNNVTSNN